MTLYRLLLTRTDRCTIWVEADDEDNARAAAQELGDVVDWLEGDESDIDDVDIVDEVPEGERYWSGGEAGGWVQT